MGRGRTSRPVQVWELLTGRLSNTITAIGRMHAPRIWFPETEIIFKGTKSGRRVSDLVACSGMADELDVEKLVELHYQGLFRFAFSLTHNEPDACDLTQEAFLILARSGSQIRDKSKAKNWLFTTLHREYLGRRRKMIRFPQSELEEAEGELPLVPPQLESADGPGLMLALGRIDPAFQAAVSLFFLEDHSYAEIAEILEVPLGTVKSRISRGIGQLQRLLLEAPTSKGAQ